MTRLTATFWVQAYLRRLSLVNIPAFVVSQGDDTAGSVLVKQTPLDGSARLFQRGFSLDGPGPWEVLAQGSERKIDATITRQKGIDPDIWVIEVEDRQGRHLLDEDGLG
ncbi:MAG: DUF1491 family protein [Rhodobacteraceae bacterium]|nr:DUF1491 family protein [Paracoccaceae bacterium]